LGEVDPAAVLGSPDDFVREFRASAGLDADPEQAPRLLARIARRASSRWSSGRTWLTETFEPAFRPFVRNQADIRTTWIWTRGLLAVLAFSWITGGSPYDAQWFLGSGFGTGLAVAALATYLSVRLARSARPLWRRFDTLVSMAAVALVLLAIVSPRWAQFPDEVAFYEEPYQETPSAPVLLIGPNGPIQNLYAYDVTGNPVEVLLFDEYGNPIQTLPEYAYEEFEAMDSVGSPFIWEGFEIRFQVDARGNPIGNLFPLERYEWTQGGPRSAPQPPPIVVIPPLPVEPGNDTEAVVPNVETTTPAVPTSMPTEEAPPETAVTEPPTTTTDTD
jgi:hypothetical protein